MFDLKKDRLNYGALISPPEGYELTKAIGTTYTLDLYALLAIPVALFYAKSMEGDFTLNRYDILEAIRKSAGKVDVFCQRGKIKVPTKYNNLLALMEDCVTEIQPPILHSSFHPKLWVLKFENGENTIYRLIVLSRNLTFDRSWDLSFYSDGIVTNQIQNSSQKLSTFLQGFYTTANKEIDKELFTELEKVEFEIPFGFNEFDIFPIEKFTTKSPSFDNPLDQLKYRELLVISPFVDEKIIEKLKKNNKKLVLISRKEELDKLEVTCLEGIELYCLNPLVSEAEFIIDSEGDEMMSQNLHAKLFIGQTADKTDWFLGSANATAPAFERNVEFLVKISSTENSKKIKKVVEMLLNQNESIFQIYTPQEIKLTAQTDNLEKEIREMAYFLTNQNFEGEIIKNSDNENYSLKLLVDLTSVKKNDFTVEVRLIHRKEDVELLNFETINILIFNNISIVNLSIYLIVDIKSKNELKSSFTIKMNVDIPDEREDVIFSNLINNKIKLFEYLQFLLSSDQVTTSLLIKDSNPFNESEMHIMQDVFGKNNSIYESLMIAASRSPKKLTEIDRVVNKLEKSGSEILEDFMPIWSVFKEFAHD